MTDEPEASVEILRAPKPEFLTETRFDSFDLPPEVLQGIAEAGFEYCTPIQAEALPGLLQGRDVAGQAHTGTGKTAAFLVTVITRLLGMPDRKTGLPQAIIMAPTRELSRQIVEEAAILSRHTDITLLEVVGGIDYKEQAEGLQRGTDIVIGTPGRIIDYYKQGILKTKDIKFLVIDEADRLLDMGFIRDVKRIVAQTPKTRQSLLFSATMPSAVAALAREILKDPVRVDVSPKQMTVKEIDQRIVMVGNGDKQRMLEHLLRDDEVSRAIVFTRTKHGANKVARKLEGAGIGAEAIHGNKSQNARQRALQNFKNGDSWVLVATDIAARGIDIDAVSHVFNYELPHEPESYVHRIGRTGRAGASGAAWSLVDPSERGRLRAVEKLIKFSPTEMAVDLPPRDPGEPSQRIARAPRRPAGYSGDQRSGAPRQPRRRRRQPAA